MLGLFCTTVGFGACDEFPWFCDFVLWCAILVFYGNFVAVVFVDWMFWVVLRVWFIVGGFVFACVLDWWLLCWLLW